MVTLGIGRRAALAVGVGAACLVAPAAAQLVAPGVAHATPADVAATRVYLEAVRTYAQAYVANLPQSEAAAEALVTRVGSECGGALAHAPVRSSASFSGSSPGPLSARQRGEEKRETEQLGALEDELDRAFASAFEQPDRAAMLAYAAALAPLRWSNATLTQLVHERLGALDGDAERSPPAVCADIETWVASAYRKLAPATKKLAEAHDAPAVAVAGSVSAARAAKFIHAGSAASAFSLRSRRKQTRPPTIAQLLKPYETAEDKTLIAQIQALAQQAAGALDAIEKVAARLRSVVGLGPAFGELQREREQRAVVVGHGTTQAGLTYVVKFEPPEPAASSGEPPCKLLLTVTAGSHASGNVGDTGCFARGDKFLRPSVSCADGRRAVVGATPARVRSVRLRLQDGREIVSRVVLVPARLGGPVGVYYQIVRSKSAIPVSLVELDAHGRTVRVVKLNRVAGGCVNHSVKFLPGGLRKIVRATVPQGPSFAIIGQYYLFMGHKYFEMSIETEQGGGGESPSGKRLNVFSWHMDTGCEPHPYAIVYGLLKARGDTVLARTAAGLVPLRKVVIPKSLHAGGLLVYAALAEAPSELVVRAASGSTVVVEKLGSLAREAAETCEGEAE